MLSNMVYPQKSHVYRVKVLASAAEFLLLQIYIISNVACLLKEEKKKCVFPHHTCVFWHWDKGWMLVSKQMSKMRKTVHIFFHSIPVLPPSFHLLCLCSRWITKLTGSTIMTLTYLGLYGICLSCASTYRSHPVDTKWPVSGSRRHFMLCDVTQVTQLLGSLFYPSKHWELQPV